MTAIPENPAEVRAEELLAIRAVVDDIDRCIDEKDWNACEALFAEVVYADFASFTGEPAGEVNRSALVEGWKEALPPDVVTQHMRTNHRITMVEDGRAKVLSKGYSVVRAASDEQGPNEFWAGFRHDMVKIDAAWRCAGMAMNLISQRTASQTA